MVLSNRAQSTPSRPNKTKSNEGASAARITQHDHQPRSSAQTWCDKMPIIFSCVLFDFKGLKCVRYCLFCSLGFGFTCDYPYALCRVECTRRVWNQFSLISFFRNGFLVLSLLPGLAYVRSHFTSLAVIACSEAPQWCGVWWPDEVALKCIVIFTSRLE